MAINNYTLGNVVRLSAAFTVSGNATDPTAVTLKVRSPGGTISTYTYAADISKSSTGNYYKDVTPGSEGRWYYQWTGTGTCPAVEEGVFVIDPSQFD